MADNEKLEAPPDWKGPVESRKSTDILMAIVLLACWGLMTYLGIDAMEKGDPALLVAGTDYKGRVCGYDESVQDKPYLYYITADGTGVCVAECPDYTDPAQFICTDEPDGPEECNVKYQSHPAMGRCIFTDRAIFREFMSSVSGRSKGGSGVTLHSAAKDLWTAKYYILNFGLVVSVVMGFIYLWILRLPGLVGMIIWTSIFAIFFTLAALAYGLWYQAVLWVDDGIHDEYDVLMMKICAGIAGVLAIVWMCLACCMRKNIILAGGVITEAARPILLMPLLFAWPILQLIGVALFMWPWTYYVLYTASMGEWVNETDAFGMTTPQYQYDDSVQWRGWYLLFCLIWTVEWLVAIGQIVLALSVAQWYFSRDKASVHSGVAVRAIFQTFYYHTGTAAMGSLLLAILTLLRIMLTQIQKKAESSGNVVVKAFFCCCQCCLWCLDKCIRFINKNAYIQTAIFSYGFYTGCVKSFFLILRNVGRVTAVTVVGEFVIKVMQLVIVGVSGAVAYFVMDSYLEEELNSLIVPTIFVMVLAWYISTKFAEIFGMAILTILQCFIADEEMFDPSQMYAHGDLKDYIDTFGGERKALIN